MINNIGYRNLCRPIWTVIILMIRQIGLLLCSRPVIFAYHLYD